MENDFKVDVAESRIPGSGKGLFAKDHFKRGQVIMQVTGPRYSPTEVEELHNENDYLLELNDGSGDCIEVTGGARYANDAKGIYSIPGLYNNAQFCSAEDHSMYLAATRTIPKGEEILVNYGKAYWKGLVSK
jgi:hypothetical protein